MQKRQTIFLTVAAALVFLCISTASGKEQTQYSSIVSLGPAVTRTLVVLGANEKIKGVTTYCLKNETPANAVAVGTVTQPNIESIALLKPDLVITTTMTPPRSIELMQKMGLRTEMINSPVNFDELCEQFIHIGTLGGTEEKARTIVKDARKKVETVRARTKPLPKPEVIIQVGANPVFVATPGRLLNDYITFAGAVNAVSADCRGMYSREAVIGDNPDVIIITAMGIGNEEKLKWEKYPSLKAAKGKRIYIMNPYNMCSPTPDVFADTLETLAKLLHPELKT